MVVLRVSYGCHEISKSTSMDCNKIHSDSVVRKIMGIARRFPRYSYTVVHMVKDPPATILHVYTVANNYTAFLSIMIVSNYMALRAMCKYFTLLTASLPLLCPRILNTTPG